MTEQDIYGNYCFNVCTSTWWMFYNPKKLKKILFYGVEPSRGVFFLMQFNIHDGKSFAESLKAWTADSSFWTQVLEGPAGLQGFLKVWVFVTRSFLKKPLDIENHAFVARDPDSCQPQVFGLLPLSAASFLICKTLNLHDDRLNLNRSNHQTLPNPATGLLPVALPRFYLGSKTD